MKDKEGNKLLFSLEGKKIEGESKIRGIYEKTQNSKVPS